MYDQCSIDFERNTMCDEPKFPTLAEFKKNLIFFLCQHMRKAKVSPLTIACKAGCSAQTMTNLTSGNGHLLSTDMLLRIAFALDLRVDVELSYCQPTSVGKFSVN